MDWKRPFCLRIISNLDWKTAFFVWGSHLLMKLSKFITFWFEKRAFLCEVCFYIWNYHNLSCFFILKQLFSVWITRNYYILIIYHILIWKTAVWESLILMKIINICHILDWKELFVWESLLIIKLWLFFKFWTEKQLFCLRITSTYKLLQFGKLWFEWEHFFSEDLFCLRNYYNLSYFEFKNNYFLRIAINYFILICHIMFWKRAFLCE